MSLHVRVVDNYLNRIKMKRDFGEKLTPFEKIENGSEAFWELDLLEKEKFLEMTEHDF